MWYIEQLKIKRTSRFIWKSFLNHFDNNLVNLKKLLTISIFKQIYIQKKSIRRYLAVNAKVNKVLNLD